jgi:membrane associated rhomboid family serine protease
MTIGIIAINLLLMILTRRDMTYYSQVYANTYGLIPARLRPGSLLTSAFLHDGYVHLTLNMILLYCFGSRVERIMGRLEYFIFYLAACFAASLAHVAIVYASLPDYYGARAVVGASGAVAAVMGVYAVRFHRRIYRFAGVEAPALLIIMAWLVLQLVLGILGLYRDEILGLGLRQVGYWGHLGGFAFGVAVALIANMAVDGEREYLTEQAHANCEEDNLLEAVHNHEGILNYDPANADSHAELGRLWALLEERGESLRCYQVAIQLYISRGHEDRAIAVAEDMGRFWPGSRLSAGARFRLATYLEEIGETERALDGFKGIAENEPESVEAQMSLLKVGQIQLSTLGEPERAAASLRQFVERYPESEWLRFAQETLARATHP